MLYQYSIGRLAGLLAAMTNTRTTGWARWGRLGALGLLSACNLITGASRLSTDGGVEHDESVVAAVATVASGASTHAAGPSGSGGSNPTGGVGGSSTSSSQTAASSSVASTGAGGAPPPPPPPVGNAADGVSVTDVKLYQSLEVPLTKPSDIPIVAGKPAMVRIFYSVDSKYDGQPVTARFSAGKYYVEKTQTLSGASSQSSLTSTVNIDVPDYMITTDTGFRVDLVQPNGSGTNSSAGYPQGTQQSPLGAKSAGTKLRVVLVPVSYAGKLPDTSSQQVQKYVDRLSWQYPIAKVEVTVRSQPYSYNGNLGSYNGWSDLLNKISDLREADNVDPQIYYYGVHMGTNTGLLGLGWIANANDSWSRAAIGVGTTGDSSAQTCVHEIGHTHGRQHSPCGVSGDPAYPHAGAKIGVWGYHPAALKLIGPTENTDFMSYCHPQWVSDHTYKALFKRLQYVNGGKLMVPGELANRAWDRIQIIDGQAKWLDPITLADPPQGDVREVIVTTGSTKQTVKGHYFAYDHLDAGVLFVLRPKEPPPLQWLEFNAEGQAFGIAR
jgi:hypothetical protein